MDRIPFESPDFDWTDLERFMVAFLNSGISLPVDGVNGIQEKRIISAASYGVKGDDDQGIDVRAKVEGGEIWAFQCKLYTRGKQERWTLRDSKKIVAAASYTASRYFAVVVAKRGAQPKAIDYLDAREKWEYWDASTLSTQFLSRTNLEDGISILTDFFGKPVASKVYALLNDEILITAKNYFTSTTIKARAFNHLTPLIGRRELVNAMHQFVKNSTTKVLLVSARGGEGKSRALREFSNEFETSHPKRILRFVNHSSNKQATESSLGYLLKKNPVIVQEDAHRLETLRPAILQAIADDATGNVKLIITLRPQSKQAVLATLNNHGLPCEVIDETPLLAPLKQNEILKLAKEVLGSTPRVAPHVLARLSDLSPLICVVGGNLIRQKKLTLHEMADSKIFRQEVFTRFEQQILEPINPLDSQRIAELKRLLRILAVLAPLHCSKESINNLAKFLECRGSNVEMRLEELELADLITKTEQGWRVWPDLFADHLVYTSCVKNGEPSTLCDEVVENFGANHYPALLRNLSEAEWRARIEGDKNTDLTTPLWKNFQGTFKNSSFYERREMLDSWTAFSFFLPEKSLELAKLAIISNKAPKQKTEAELGFYKSPLDTQRSVIEKIPHLLQPIGIYHFDQQFEVFDLLAQLGRGWSPDTPMQMIEENNHPWVIIGKAASFALDQPIDSINSVIKWIPSCLEKDWSYELIDTPCRFLTVALKPVFKHIIERTYSEGMHVIFQTIPLSSAQTEPYQKAAFALIEGKLILRSEIACLNVIPVLKSAISRHSESSMKLKMNDWQASRLHGFKTLEKSLDHWSSPFIRFEIWKAASSCIPYEKDEKIIKTATALIAKIPNDLALSLAMATLGDSSDFLLEGDIKQKPDYEQAWKEWPKYCHAVGAKLLDDFDTNPDLLNFLEKFASDAQERNYYPNWGAVICGIGTGNKKRATGIIEEILGGKVSLLDAHISIFIDSTFKTNPIDKDRYLALAIQSNNPSIQRSALKSLLWLDADLGDSSKKALSNLLRSTKGEDIKIATETISESFTTTPNRLLEFIPQLPLTRLDPESISTLLKSITQAIGYRHIEFNKKFLCSLLLKIERINDIGREPYSAFLKSIARFIPREIYEFYRKRIETHSTKTTTERNRCPSPIPYQLNLWTINNLDKEGDFENILTFLIKQVRESAPHISHYWQDLFQVAALLNDVEKSLFALDQWLDEIDNFNDLRQIVEIFNLSGSTFVFKYPQFCKKILTIASSFSPADEKNIRQKLMPHTNGRAYSNGKLDKEYDYLLKEAQAATSAHANDSTLAKFYQTVVKREMNDRNLFAKDYQNQMANLG